MLDAVMRRKQPRANMECQVIRRKIPRPNFRPFREGTICTELEDEMSGQGHWLTGAFEIAGICKSLWEMNQTVSALPHIGQAPPTKEVALAPRFRGKGKQ